MISIIIYILIIIIKKIKTNNKNTKRQTKTIKIIIDYQILLKSYFIIVNPLNL